MESILIAIPLLLAAVAFVLRLLYLFNKKAVKDALREYDAEKNNSEEKQL